MKDMKQPEDVYQFLGGGGGGGGGYAKNYFRIFSF